MASFFTYNKNSNCAPSGCIIQYCGTLDPDGWIICDGQPRTATDNRFNNLAPILNTILGVTTNNSNSITPPDLRSKFLYGGSSTNSVFQTGGSSTQTLTIDQMPSHSHNVTDGGHSHTTGFYCNLNGGYGSGSNSGLFGNYNSSSNRVGVDTNNVKTGITLVNSGKGQEFSIMPPYYTINHIIKY